MVEVPYAKYPTIVLDNSYLVTSVVCDATTCTFTFATPEALDTAAKNWQALDAAMPGDGIVVVTSTAAISGNSIISDRAYLLIKDIKYINRDLRLMICDYKMLGFEEILEPAQNVTVSIGHGKNNTCPFDSGNTGTLPGTGSGTGNGTSPGTGGNGSGGNSTAPGGGSTGANGTYVLTGPCANATDFDLCLDDRIGYMDPNNPNVRCRKSTSEARALNHSVLVRSTLPWRRLDCRRRGRSQGRFLWYQLRGQQSS